TAAGTYAVVASVKSSNTNYAGSVTGSLVIGKAVQSISFPPITGTFNVGDTYPLNATNVSTPASGVAVTYAATGPGSISGTTLTITGPGLVTVTASLAGNSNYEAAVDVSRSVSAGKATATLAAIAPGQLGKTYNGAAHPVTTTV